MLLNKGQYTTNNEKIKYSIFILSILIFIFLSFLLRNCLKNYVEDTLILFLILYPISLFFGTFTLFEIIGKLFFKIPFLKKQIPNFNGTWIGKGQSKFKNKEFEAKLEIKQSLNTISINAFFNQSKSESFNCLILKENNKEKLIYNYSNEAKAVEELDNHYGTMILEKTKNRLEGNYFTNRKIQTKGILELKKENNNAK